MRPSEHMSYTYTSLHFFFFNDDPVGHSILHHGLPEPIDALHIHPVLYILNGTITALECFLMATGPAGFGLYVRRRLHFVTVRSVGTHP